MYEVEVKVRADHDAVRDTLAARGAERLDRVEQADTYFDAPHRDFAATDEALRVRRVTVDGVPESRITYKGPLVDDASKSRIEVETAVGDGDDATTIFERLGFTPVATVEKTRERFRLDEYTVVLDDVTGLGEFLEIETETVEDPAALESARAGAFERLRALGLDPEDQLRTSYLGLLLDD
jgi:adenylate cyclase class 2